MEKNELLDYFIKHTDDRFDRLESKVDDLRSFKWKGVGALTVLSVFFGVGTQILFRFFGG